MTRKYLVLNTLLALLIFLLASCAPSVYDITQDYLQQGKTDEAIALARLNLVTRPDDPLFLKYLGIGLYNKKLFRDAASFLEKYLTLDEEDDQAVYYLASCYEQMSEFARAIKFYRRYNELTIFGEYKELVAARIKILFASQMQQEVKKAIIEESQLATVKVPVNTIAVLYFENKGTQKNLDPLQKGLAEMIITDLSKVKSLKIVERIRLQKLVEEIKLGESGLVDEKTSPRVGRLLGAARLVKGSFFDLTSQKMRIDVLVARTKTSQIEATADISGSTKEFFQMEKELVFKIVDELGISLTSDEREAIMTVPTENFFAFLQYAQGLHYEDQGMYSQAALSYSSALQADPNFTEARSNMASAQRSQEIMGSTTTNSSTTSSSTGSSQPAAAPLAPPPPPSSVDIRNDIGSVTDRVNLTTSNTTAGFTPGASSQSQTPQTILRPLPAPPQPPK